MKDFINTGAENVLIQTAPSKTKEDAVNRSKAANAKQTKSAGTELYRIFQNIIPDPFVMTLLATVFLLLTYSLLRLGFLIYNRACFTGIPGKQILTAFLFGLRFDLSGILMLNAGIFGLYNLPGHPTRNPRFSRLLFIIFCILNLAGILLTFVDYTYYPVIFRRTTYEPFVVPLESLAMMSGMISGYWHLGLLILAACIAFTIVSKIFFSFLAKHIHYEFFFFKDTIFLIILIGLIVLGIRGGLQSQPIRQSHAFFSSERSLGYLALNTPFNIILSLNQNSPVTQMSLVEENEAKTALQDMLYHPGERNLASGYPFLRQSLPTTNHPLKYNVVVLIMESWSASHIGALGASPSATPFFDTLAENGLLFTNFFSNGQRSVEAAPAILASLPHILNAPLIGSLSELNEFLGMGTIFTREGYTTSFHHGAKTGSMGFDAYSRLAGFEHYFGKEDVSTRASENQDGVWGIYDHLFFADMISRLETFSEPFCSIFYSLSPHDPLMIPEKLKPLFISSGTETTYNHVLRYSDYSLQQFFKQAKNKPWFDRTVFVIIGDHPYDAAPNDFRSAFHVPLLIYAPALVKPNRDNSIASQVDILPTLLDLLSIPDAHASMGKSLLHPEGKRFAVVKYGTQYALITDDFAFLSDLHKTEGLYDYQHDPKLTQNLMTLMPDESARFKHQLFSYLQEVTTAVLKNKICRTEDLAVMTTSRKPNKTGN